MQKGFACAGCKLSPCCRTSGKSYWCERGYDPESDVKPDGATKVKIGLIFVVVIFLGVVVFDYIERSSPSPRVSTPVATSAPVATDDRQAKVMLYMSCLGFSSSTAAKSLQAAGGDVDKVLTMTHMAVTGELSEEPPLTDREKTCLRSSGL